MVGMEALKSGNMIAMFAFSLQFSSFIAAPSQTELKGYYMSDIQGGFRRRALLELYSTRINYNLDRPKRD